MTDAPPAIWEVPERPTEDDVCAFADAASTPTLAMLKQAAERLDRTPPDIHGAKIGVHGARLAVAYEQLSAAPSPRLEREEVARVARPFLIDARGLDSMNAHDGLALDAIAGRAADAILSLLKQGGNKDLGVSQDTAQAGSVQPDRDGERTEPDYCYLEAEWEFTADWEERALVEEQIGPFDYEGVHEVCCLVKAPSKFIARVPTERADDGEVTDDELRWFDSREEAQAALAAACPATPAPSVGAIAPGTSSSVRTNTSLQHGERNNG